jgi:hypothetical protein
MAFRYLHIFVVVAACGCASSAPPGGLPTKPPAPALPRADREIVVGPPTIVGALGRFVPLIAATEDGGECKRLASTGASGPTTILLLAFPQWTGTKRNVSVTFDSTGRRLRYSDLRGDLRRDKTGPETLILIDFERGTSHVANEWPDRPAQGADGEAALALQALNLDRPEHMIALVKERCGPL